MKKLIVLLMVVALSSAGLANLVTNGSFETTFTDWASQTVDAAVPNSYAYGGNGDGTGSYMPGWGGEQNWGYAWNPTGSGGVNHFGQTAGFTSVSDGSIAYGAGHAAHYFGIWQLLGSVADGTQDYTLTFDVYQPSAIAGGAWLVAKIQMLDGPGGYMEAAMGAIGTPSGLPADSWQSVELTMTANAGFDGSQIQVFLQGAGGTYVDNVSLTPEPATMMLLGLGGLLIRKRK